jgi:hypothetical protein
MAALPPESPYTRDDASLLTMGASFLANGFISILSWQTNSHPRNSLSILLIFFIVTSGCLQVLVPDDYTAASPRAAWYRLIWSMAVVCFLISSGLNVALSQQHILFNNGTQAASVPVAPSMNNGSFP